MDNFHEFRKKGIGGSDVASIIGCNPWKSKLEVYFDKTDPDFMTEENQAMHWGKMLEPQILQEYENKNSVALIKEKQIVDKKYNFLRGNLDGLNKEDNVIVEAKNVMQSKYWEESIPMYYLTQIAHYAAIQDASKVDVAVLFHGNEFKVFTYERNLKLEKLLRDKCIQFWEDHIVKNVEPPLETEKDFKSYYRAVEGKKIVIATPEIASIITERKQLKVEIIERNNKIKEFDIKIKEFLAKKANIIVSPESKDILVKAINVNKTILDSIAFRNENPELYDIYKKEISFTMLR